MADGRVFAGRLIFPGEKIHLPWPVFQNNQSGDREAEY